MISLCMIVRDEEANLPRVLGSVRGLADEIVIVDTGSKDRTIDVAKSFGARVETIAWCDDFAAARNHALSLAKGDWILVLDADDEFVDAAAARALLSTKYDAISVRQTIGPSVEKCQLAIFRNRADLRYRFRVHEHVPIDPAKVLRSDLRIVHHGYTPELLPAKRARNERLLELMKRDADPEARIAASFYLGQEHAREQRLERAVEEYKLAAYSKVPCAWRLYAVFRLAHLSADRTYAVALLESLLKSNPGAVEAELVLAENLLALGRTAEARTHFETARASKLRLFPNGEEPWEKQSRRRLEQAFAPKGRRRLKIGAAIPVLNEWRFMPAVVGQLLQVCDRVVVMRGLRALSGASVEIGPIPKLDPRVEIVEGAWAGEGETRNAGMDRLGECDYTWMADSDEILLDRDLAALRELCETQDLPAIGVRMLTYWKTPEYRIDPPERLVAQIVARKGVRVKGLRDVQAPVTVANLWCRHLSYVRTDEEVKEKLRLFSHASEILPDWYEHVWKAWDVNPNLEKLHPTHPAAYRRAIFDPDPELNAVLARWGCAWTTEVKA